MATGKENKPCESKSGTTVCGGGRRVDVNTAPTRTLGSASDLGPTHCRALPRSRRPGCLALNHGNFAGLCHSECLSLFRDSKCAIRNSTDVKRSY